jgi:hypothetical protein
VPVFALYGLTQIINEKNFHVTSSNLFWLSYRKANMLSVKTEILKSYKL